MIFSIDRHPGSHCALLEADRARQVSYAELVDAVSASAAVLRARAGASFGLLVTEQSSGCIAAGLSAWEAATPCCLCEARTPYLIALVERYSPRFILAPAGSDLPAGYAPVAELAWGYWLYLSENRVAYAAPHSQLALCLSTSGSTGSAKLVRLSRAALEANARSIGEYLDLNIRERAILSLPVHYSYGLSIVNSHLMAGGSLVLTAHSFMRPEFWACCRETLCTSFAGVPYMYEVMNRLRYNPAECPHMRTLTQAGGPLKQELVRHFNGQMSAVGGQLFVMYGQTEATARMAYLPPASLPEKAGSIGIAIPGGKLWLEDTLGDTDDYQELCYAGKNVMLGYANSSEDIALGDVQQGRLKTGDLARVDAEGFYTITGRLKRFAKVFGKRISLLDVEQAVEGWAQVDAAAVEGQGDIRVFVAENAGTADTSLLRQRLAKLLEITPAAIKIMLIDAIPLTPSGKKDYTALAK